MFSGKVFVYSAAEQVGYRCAACEFLDGVDTVVEVASLAAVDGFAGTVVMMKRVNARPGTRFRYNLNFAPNDAITLGVGMRVMQDTELSLFTIKDDRLGTEQRVTHLIARRMLDKQQRLSLDVTHKSGTSTEGNQVVGNGIALTYDFEPWFMRVAYDPYVNFTESQMTLFALGKRF